MKGKTCTTEDKIRILLEADGGKTVQEICQERNIAEQSFYRWKRVFGMMEVSEARRLKDLERENPEFKKMFAEEMLKNRAVSFVCEKKAVSPASRQVPTEWWPSLAPMGLGSSPGLPRRLDSSYSKTPI
jgi:putative transposase